MASRITLKIFLGLALSIFVTQAHAQPCVNILHDEIYNDAQKGPINAIFLANLMGHWPQYEVRVLPVTEYLPSGTEECKATFYLATQPGTEVPASFLSDFFETDNNVAWVGFGQQQLDQARFAETFGYRAVGELGVDDENADAPAFYEYVTYKGSVFVKDSVVSEEEWDADYVAVNFEPTEGFEDLAQSTVLSELVHNKTGERKPYFLRRENRFVVGDLPFAYMHEGGRYFAFADLMFDILGEEPRRTDKLAFVRIEDVHGLYDIDLLKATFATLDSEGVPISIAHIPLFMDPHNAQGYGAIETPKPSNETKEFADLIEAVGEDARNAVIWHGTTHQYGKLRNPSGSSGDDYEFWDALADRPIHEESVAGTLARLRTGLPIFETYDVSPRYWVTPHYQGSALNNRVFGEVFPWVIGRVTYYPTSLGSSFTLTAVAEDAASNRPSVTRDTLKELTQKPWPNLDLRSQEGLGQLFPFEIYRDVYGQRIIPETLNYLNVIPAGPSSRDVAQFLADAQRNLVIRDYWASFFFHPYIFKAVEDGGAGRYFGDTSRLRKILIGLKGLGYSFVGLPEFEASIQSNPTN